MSEATNNPGVPPGAVLTDREMLIAKQAAKIAVKEITEGFYAEVGRTVVTRVLIWIGVAAVAFAAGKGWIKFPG
jgi:hypothetical protein